jgi:hypothetical protein
MDAVSEFARREVPWDMLYVDDFDCGLGLACQSAIQV